MAGVSSPEDTSIPIRYDPGAPFAINLVLNGIDPREFLDEFKDFQATALADELVQAKTIRDEANRRVDEILAPLVRNLKTGGAEGDAELSVEEQSKLLENVNKLKSELEEIKSKPERSQEFIAKLNFLDEDLAKITDPKFARDKILIRAITDQWSKDIQSLQMSRGSKVQQELLKMNDDAIDNAIRDIVTSYSKLPILQQTDTEFRTRLETIRVLLETPQLVISTAAREKAIGAVALAQALFTASRESYAQAAIAAERKTVEDARTRAAAADQVATETAKTVEVARGTRRRNLFIGAVVALLSSVGLNNMNSIVSAIPSIGWAPQTTQSVAQTCNLVDSQVENLIRTPVKDHVPLSDEEKAAMSFSETVWRSFRTAALGPPVYTKEVVRTMTTEEAINKLKAASKNPAGLTAEMIKNCEDARKTLNASDAGFRSLVFYFMGAGLLVSVGTTVRVYLVNPEDPTAIAQLDKIREDAIAKVGAALESLQQKTAAADVQSVKDISTMRALNARTSASIQATQKGQLIRTVGTMLEAGLEGAVKGAVGGPAVQAAAAVLSAAAAGVGSYAEDTQTVEIAELKNETAKAAILLRNPADAKAIDDIMSTIKPVALPVKEFTSAATSAVIHVAAEQSLRQKNAQVKAFLEATLNSVAAAEIRYEEQKSVLANTLAEVKKKARGAKSMETEAQLTAQLTAIEERIKSARTSVTGVASTFERRGDDVLTEKDLATQRTAVYDAFDMMKVVNVSLETFGRKVAAGLAAVTDAPTQTVLVENTQSVIPATPQTAGAVGAVGGSLTDDYQEMIVDLMGLGVDLDVLLATREKLLHAQSSPAAPAPEAPTGARRRTYRKRLGRRTTRAHGAVTA